jgi:hypothetical protein
MPFMSGGDFRMVMVWARPNERRHYRPAGDRSIESLTEVDQHSLV